MFSPKWVPFNAYLYFLHLPSFENFLPRIASLDIIPVPENIRNDFWLNQPFHCDLDSILILMPPLMLVGLLGVHPVGSFRTRRLGVALIGLSRMALS